MKTLLVIAAGTVSLLATGVAYAQDANMMNSGGGFGWMGGYGGIWAPILVIVVVVGLVAWFVTQKGK